MNRLRLYAAGVVAFLLGMPLTARVFAEGTTQVARSSIFGDVGSITSASVGLAAAIIDSSAGDS